MTDTIKNTTEPKETIGPAKETKKPEIKKSFFDKFMDALDKMEGKARQAFRKIFGVSSRPKGPTNTPPPNSPGPEFKVPTLPDWYWKGIRAVTRALPKALLAAAVLTGFAEKKTDTPTAADKEPPRATLNVGTLGVTVAKVKINNGDKTTDFDANMPLAKAAKEVVGTVLPQSEQDKLFTDNPIKSGAFSDISATVNKNLDAQLSPAAIVKRVMGKKDNTTLLREGADDKAAPKTAPTKVPDKVLADRLGKDI